MVSKNKKRLTYILLFFMWGGFQYALGNKVYVFFIIIFFLITIPRKPSYILLATSILTIVLLKTPVVDTWVSLKELNNNAIENIDTSLEKVFKPNSGEVAIPNVAQQIYSLIEKNHISNYRLSAQLIEDPYIHQRVVEFVWPARLENDSVYLFVFKEEIKNTQLCSLIEEKKDVVLVHCP